MDAFTQMELHKEDLSPREQEIYRLFRDNPEEIAASSSTAIAKRFHVSQSAVSRFCKKVGFRGYGDFRINMVLSFEMRNKPRSRQSRAREDIADDIAAYIREIRIVATDQALGQLCSRISRARLVYTIGQAASSLGARYLAFLLVELSVRAQFVSSGWEEQMLSCMTDEDLIIIFSARNPSQQRFLKALRARGEKLQPSVMLITQTARHPLRSLADDIFVLPTRQAGRACRVGGCSASMLYFDQLLADAMTRAMKTAGALDLKTEMDRAEDSAANTA
ncbi:transcriptional regulator, RpiR family [Coriobacterium glomerans PW2]|uniref:Transcriptional regulator, RpiR family n=1 Tax=Coriobacterium glomerans (strain ATCC 49209 / DSM 20642 / JCM 10262 / PW2) TaxID=700015 RepID=F2NBG1_CORGP|nr:MurR/RpiR family transcriptional regulator [Coriobacterium glomerans]AEB06697.1 transcriptional regulator, RpiR family [Coriobacterium glomerans PW2]